MHLNSWLKEIYYLIYMGKYGFRKWYILDILKWFSSKGILPNVHGANRFPCKNGHLNVLKWLDSKGILPNDHGPDKVYFYKTVISNVLKWLEEQGSYYHGNVWGAK